MRSDFCLNKEETAMIQESYSKKAASPRTKKEEIGQEKKGADSSV